MKWCQNKIEAFQRAVEYEFDKVLHNNIQLRNRLIECRKEMDKLRKVLQNYEISATKEVIRGSGNMQAIEVYLNKPQLMKKHKGQKRNINLDYLNFMTEDNITLLTSSVGHKTKTKTNKLKEFEEGFRVFQDLMMANLKYLEGKSDTANEGIQVVDYERIEREEENERQKEKLEQKIQEIKRQFDDQTVNFARKYQTQQIQFDKKEHDLQGEIDNLKKKCDKMYKELVQVKHILRTPYLYQKYQNAKFSEFAHLDV
jgi:hypothetical protein